MNLLSRITEGWKWPTRWQCLVIVWLVVLNTSPYVVGFWASNDFGNFEWRVWSITSVPFAHIGMFSYLAVAGGWPIMARRLLAVTGALMVICLMMTIVGENAVIASAWLLIEAIVIVSLTLLTCRFWGIPIRPNHWSLQFSLAEIIILSGLLGVFLFMVREAGATDLEKWTDPALRFLITFAIASGIYLVPVCLATIATSRRGKILCIVFSILLWAIFPLCFLLAFTGFEEMVFGNWILLYFLYPALGSQLLLAWGTLFPIRICFPGVLFAKEAPPATAAQCKPDTLADAPENCRQSEHTDVPD